MYTTESIIENKQESKA